MGYYEDRAILIKSMIRRCTQIGELNPAGKVADSLSHEALVMLLRLSNERGKILREYSYGEAFLAVREEMISSGVIGAPELSAVDLRNLTVEQLKKVLGARARGGIRKESLIQLIQQEFDVISRLNESLKDELVITPLGEGILNCDFGAVLASRCLGAEDMRSRIVDLEHRIGGDLGSWWALSGKRESGSKLTSHDLVESVFCRNLPSREVFHEKLLWAFELSFFRVCMWFGVQLPREHPLAAIEYLKSNGDVWKRFLNDWGVVFMIPLTSDPEEPCFTKIYSVDSRFRPGWLLQDRKTPRVVRLGELVLSDFAYLSETDSDDDLGDGEAIHSIPEEITARVQMGPVSGLDDGAFIPVPRGFGFKDGKIAFIGLDHEEYEFQKKTKT